MGGATAEGGLGRWTGRLVLASAALCAALSLLYLLAAVLPLYHLRGYVSGHYSVLGYELSYAYDRRPVPMPHTDYVWHVSAAFAASSAALLALSALSAALARRRPPAAAGLVYGVAAGTILLFGLLRGYILRAVALDLGRFNSLLRERVVARTLAGTVEFEGVALEPTPVLAIVQDGWPLLVLTAAAVATSLAAVLLAARGALAAAAPAGPGQGPRGTRPGPAYAVLGLVALSTLASAFVYYPSSLAVVPQPPPATLEHPPYAYTCAGLTRTARGALAYTDFEAYPLPGWAASGGAWSSVGGVAGAKGNVLRGDDDGRGLGRASHYYYNTDLSGHRRLWVVAKTMRVSGTGWYGISMMNSGRSRLFAVEIYTGGSLEIWSYNVVTRTWSWHASASIPGYVPGRWYVVVVSYEVTVGQTISISAVLYDAYGNYVTGVTATIAHANVFAPAYIGVEVDDVVAQFDDFAISTADPRSIYFAGFYGGMRVEVWDNLGNLVSSATAPSASFPLGIVHDVVVGTGSDGRIVVRYPDGYRCGVLAVPATDAVLGGDAYTLTAAPSEVVLGPNRVSASATLRISGASTFNTIARFVAVHAAQVLYARLLLDEVSAPSTLNADLWVAGVAESTRIEIRNGAPVTTSTSEVRLALGGGNHLVFSGYFTAAGQSAALRMRLELCTGPGGTGACVYYPVWLTLLS